MLEIKEFIRENAHFIYGYINTEVLKDVGVMNPNYFVKIIKDILNSQEKIEKTTKPNILPYLIFTLLPKRIDYTSLRTETIDFKQLNKEASTYYNYVRFFLEDNTLLIKLMQSKIGGMPIDDDIVKFSKKIVIKPSGLELFINENKDLLSKDIFILS